MKPSTCIKLLACTVFMLVTTHSFAQTTIDTSTSEATTQKPASSSATPSPQEDSIITNSIQSQIKDNATLSNLNITVSTKRGVVKLSGNIDSDSQASSLVELAESTIGVKDVDTANLKVKSSQQPWKDTLITAKVKGTFIREEVFGTKDIASINLSVETKNGVVYLTGAIDNKEQIANAIKLIRGIKGVKKVIYNVQKVTPHTDSSNN